MQLVWDEVFQISVNLSPFVVQPKLASRRAICHVPRLIAIIATRGMSRKTSSSESS